MPMIRPFETPARVALTILVLAAIACLIPDPYTYGGVGGDRHNFEFHAWQVVATGVLVALLLTGTFRKDWTSVRHVFAIELLLFLTLNLIYVGRDGIETRVVVGNYGFRLPAFLVVSGLLVRLLLLLVAGRRTPAHGSAP